MSLTLATFNLAADRQKTTDAVNAYRRLGKRARIVATQESELLVRSGRMPYRTLTVPAVKAFDRRAFMFRPGVGRTRIDLLGVHAHNIRLEHGWEPKVGWWARTWMPYIIPVDPETNQPFLMVNMHLLHDAQKGSARYDANERLVDALIDLADGLDLPTVALGDWNRRPGHRGNKPLRQAGFTINSPGGTHGRLRGVALDYAAVRGIDVLRAKVLSDYPGDHSPVLYRIRVPRATI